MIRVTSRRFFFKTAIAATSLKGQQRLRPNVVLITADDMNCDTVGAYGAKLRGVTPNIDRLASEGIRFHHAHVTVPVCQPSRSVLMTGRYPHRNGAEGFEPIRDDVPTLQEQLREAGYRNAILGKTEHLQPAHRFCWDLSVPETDLGRGRHPELYYRRAKAFMQDAKAAGKPFFLMANSHDPHKPFAGSEEEMEKFKEHLPFRRSFRAEDVPVPGFLHDLPAIRRELTQYYASAYRCDEAVGEVLRALNETGETNNTLVVFLSDNGIALPYAKANCYRHGTRTPWIVRWPGQVKPRVVDRDHMISGIDFMPTVIQAVGARQVPGADGRSFLPLLHGQRQSGRDEVVTVFHETGGSRVRFEMRCIQNKTYGYIFNAWAGEKEFREGATQNALTFPAMRDAAQADPRIATRVEFYWKRTPEELYNFASDPDALHNLAGKPEHRELRRTMRLGLHAWMKRTGDRLLATFEEKIPESV